MATAANTYKPNALMIRMLSMDDDIQPDIEDDVVVVVAHPEDENVEPERGNWTGRFDFLLSLLGYSVGLGNVWRFPYLCYNNGGGAFLIPFTVMLIVAGLPLMFMELSFGQFAALGPVAVYNKFCPLFRGLGYGMVIVSCIVMMYYNLIIAWTLHYLGVSFASIFSQLPWQNCDADWSTKQCYSYEEADRCEAQNGTYYLRECFNQTYAAAHNISVFAAVALRRPPAEEYFTNKVLGLSSGIEETGHIRWEMALCLLAAWIIVFLCLCKGVHSSGKVVYFTALFPYVVLVILFVRGVTLPGAGTGILFYLTPDFSRLATAQVWGDAAVQIFFALSPAWGGLITLSSYNRFTNNCYRDALIVAVSNIGTSFFAGLVIFSVLGFLAHELRVDVDQVVDQGPGLAFIVYPEVVTRLPVSPLWSILFFLMLLTLGLDSQFTLMETVTTAILDKFPNMRQNKVWVVLTVAVAGYLGGLIFTTNSGMYWLQLIDKYAASWSVLIIAIGECILIAWIYGTKKFCRDIQRMIGKKSKRWEYFWSAMWRFITPAALVFILVFNWIEYKPAQYGHYVYPTWADAVGWTLAVLPVVVVVIMAIDMIYSGPHDLTIMEKARVLSRPTDEWGPPNNAGPGVIARRTEPEPPVLMLHGRPVLRERGARPPHTHPLIAMRKVSLDSGDNTSITSGTENETKKSGHGIKSTKNSIKRKMLNLNIEHDNTSDEPLLHITKDKSEIDKQSAKLLLSKTKTDASAKDDEKDKLLEDNKIAKPSITDLTGIRDVLIDNSLNDLERDFSQSTSAAFHHMNRNELNGADGLKQTGTVNTQILVEVDTSKPSGYNQTQLIFTTAKIHADGIKPKHVTVKKIEDKLTEQKHTYSKLSGTIPRSSKEVNTITHSVRSLKEIKSDDSQPFTKLAENTVKSINTAKATVKSSENNTSGVNSLTTSIRSKNKFIPDKKVSTISKGKESTPLVKPVELKTAMLNPTAGDVGFKCPQVATVASSITKGKITTSNTSLPLSSSSSKKDTSLLTVKTTSSVPTAKSSIITTVPPAKKTKGVSTSVNKPTSSLANTTSPVSTNKSLSAKSTSTVTVAPNANSSETTTKSFTDNTSEIKVKTREDTKSSSSEGSNAKPEL